MRASFNAHMLAVAFKHHNELVNTHREYTKRHHNFHARFNRGKRLCISIADFTRILEVCLFDDVYAAMLKREQDKRYHADGIHEERADTMQRLQTQAWSQLRMIISTACKPETQGRIDLYAQVLRSFTAQDLYQISREIALQRKLAMCNTGYTNPSVYINELERFNVAISSHSAQDFVETAYLICNVLHYFTLKRIKGEIPSTTFK